jgi:hypothetical protein
LLSDNPDLDKCLIILDQQMLDCGYLALNSANIKGLMANESRKFAAIWKHNRQVPILNRLVANGPCSGVYDYIDTLYLSNQFDEYLTKKYRGLTSKATYTKFISFGKTFWLIRRNGRRNFYTLHIDNWTPIFFSRSPAMSFIFAGLYGLKEKVLQDAEL